MLHKLPLNEYGLDVLGQMTWTLENVENSTLDLNWDDRHLEIYDEDGETLISLKGNLDGEFDFYNHMDGVSGTYY